MSQLREIQRITIIGACINIFLAIAKLAVGLIVGSAALIADGIHSLSDLSTDFIVLAGTLASSRPPDESHAYGHGKYETFAASIIGLILVVVGGLIVWQAIFSIYEQEETSPSYAVLIVAGISIVSKEWIYQATQRVARRTASTILRANAWHHRVDSLSSMAVIFGVIAGFLGWNYGDQAGAAIIGAIITGAGLSALWTAFVEFTECSVSSHERNLIIQAIRSVPGVKGWHRIRTRVVGREVFMDLHVLVDPQLSVIEGHDICNQVERAIKNHIERPINIVIHCEPEEHSGSNDTIRH